MEEAFPIPAANAGGATQTDALTQVAEATTAAAAAAQAMAVASAATAASPTIRHARLADITITPFHGDRRMFPRFKQLCDANVGGWGDN